MNRLESIKERMDNYITEYLPDFNSNSEMREWSDFFHDMKFLLQRLERYETALQYVHGELIGGNILTENSLRVTLNKVEEALEDVHT